MAKYQLIFDDNEMGCVRCPYSYYSDGFELGNESHPEGFYCGKTKKFLGNYTNNHGLIPIPDWCKTIKKISD